MADVESLQQYFSPHQTLQNKPLPPPNIQHFLTKKLQLIKDSCLSFTPEPAKMSEIVEYIYDVIGENADVYPVPTLIVVGLAFAGLFKVALLFLSYGQMLLELFVLPGTNFKRYGAKTGAWAVVTGASDGIGKEFAIQLAKKGLNVVLVSRTESKLIALAEEIETKYKVRTKYLAFDASTDKPESYKALSVLVNSLDSVTVLINNVGQSHSIPVPFLETPEEELQSIITINNIATLKITQAVTPKILSSVKSSPKIKSGLIMTMGSFSGLTPTPLLATYSGSKAFLQAWSNALASELQPQHVDVQIVLSYLVTSAMSKIRRTSAMIPNPKQFVHATLKNAGTRHGGAQERFATLTPYWAHALMHWWINATVGVWSKIVIKINYNMHVDIRKRALRKAERLAKLQ